MSFKPHSIAIILFYMVLIFVIIQSLINLMNEPTAFEEKVMENHTILPSFTLCPSSPDNPTFSSIQSFEEVMKAIEVTRKNYSYLFQSSKSYDYK